MNLTPEQQAAVNSSARNTVIIAPAGSGKTSVLAARAAAVSNRHSTVLGSRPLCATFTVKATAELKARAPGAQAYTLHGLCRHLKTVFESEPFSVYDQVDATDVACIAGEDCGVLKAEGYKDRRKAAEKVLRDPSGKRRYLEMMRASRAVDYDLLVEDGLAIAPRAWNVDMFGTTHFLVDEAQDLDPKQRQLVETLSPAAVTLILDPRQQIFEWRGGSAAWGMEAWGAAEWSRFALVHNFRSVPAVVSLGNRIARKMPFKAPEMVATRPDGGSVESVAYDTPQDEAEDVAAWAVERAGTWEGGPPAVFILGRAWGALKLVREALSGVPHHYAGDAGDFWSSEAVRMVLRGASLVLNPWQDHWARLVANWPVPTLRPSELARGAEVCAQCDMPLAHWLAGDVVMPNGGSIARCSDLLWLDNATMRQFAAVSASVTIATILHEWRCARTLRVTGRETKAAELGALVERVKAWEATAEDKSLGAFLAWRAEATAADEAPEAPILLGTIHSVKGLEAPSVAVVGMDDRGFGDRTDEERRLAFVAVTRARDRLLLTRSATRRGEPVGPSAFWTESKDA